MELVGLCHVLGGVLLKLEDSEVDTWGNLHVAEQVFKQAVQWLVSVWQTCMVI